MFRPFHVDRMWTSTREGAEGLAHVDRGKGGQSPIFCGRHKWMAPNDQYFFPLKKLGTQQKCSRTGLIQ